jgi:predicted DsbA family dithiol-disulfide isomerase
LAFKAAEASHCAREQGKFWEMHDSMLANQKTLDVPKSYAESIGLDIEQFEACLNTDKYADEVREDMAVADKLGITGTPSFVLARTDPQNPSKVRGINYIRGALPFDAFKQTLDEALADVQKEDAPQN